MKDRMIYIYAVNDCLESITAYIQWSHIAGMRHIIVHEYLGVDRELIWGTAINHLQPIRVLIKQILVLHKAGHQEEQ